MKRIDLSKSGLTALQKSIVTKAMTAGGDFGVGLDEGQCSYLVAVIANDLQCTDGIVGLPARPDPFFAMTDLTQLTLPSIEFVSAFERLLAQVSDAETYFDCLATLHKRRLKYQKILEMQPIPTLNQVGPRGLLQYGSLPATALVGLLFWRKWMFDIDNRAGQETGYIFEPIVARSIGGQSYSAKKSPIRRRDGKGDGRQVDCIFGNRAYEIKLRVTIAASGQGRWGEELDFPQDCRASGYTPILIVFDDTQADKLDELTAEFENAGGQVLTGEAAWQHLEELAGVTMRVFLEKYVREPIRQLLSSAPDRESLPSLNLSLNGSTLTISIGGASIAINRSINTTTDETSDLIENED